MVTATMEEAAQSSAGLFHSRGSCLTFPQQNLLIGRELGANRHGCRQVFPALADVLLDPRSLASRPPEVCSVPSGLSLGILDTSHLLSSERRSQEKSFAIAWEQVIMKTYPPIPWKNPWLTLPDNGDNEGGHGGRKGSVASLST